MKLSTNGFLAVSPAALIARNTGLSDSFSRMNSDTASNSSENTNGARHAHVAHTASPATNLVVSTTIRLRMKPPATLAWMKLVKNPARPGGACSAT